MKSKATRVLLISCIAVLSLCGVVFMYLTTTVNKKISLTISEIGTI